MTPDYHAPEHVAERARQAAMRPHAEKVCAQYARGLVTLGELISELIVLDNESTHAEHDDPCGPQCCTCPPGTHAHVPGCLASYMSAAETRAWDKAALQRDMARERTQGL